MRELWNSSRVASVELRATRWSIASRSILTNAVWVMGYRGPGCSTFYWFHRISSPTVQRPLHALCGSRLASGLRVLGTRLWNGGGPISAWLRVWDSLAFRSRIFHICDEPPLASSHGTAWDT